MRSIGKSSSMQRDNEAKLQDDTVLFENDLCYPVPDVHRKRARKMSKDIARPITKRSRPIVDLPFSQWPSGKQKRAKGSNLRGKGGITKKQKYVNDILDKYTDSGKKIWNVQGDHHNLHSRVEKLKKTEIVQYQLFFSGDLSILLETNYKRSSNSGQKRIQKRFL